ncbi:hypothetical protein MKX01_003950 [Papaver californicum]|nr:hypothetical protein MKX01_003950 [Papaver californicum]
MDSEEKIETSTSSTKQIIIPTLVLGAIGGAFGLVSKHRRVLGVGKNFAAYATNSAIVTGSYCGAREFVRATRNSESGDLINSALGGLGAGAVLGRLQGGPLGAIKYSMMFAMVGTTADYVIPQLWRLLETKKESLVGGSQNPDKNWLKLPEWSPIRILDEEALAAKRAREQQLYGPTVPVNIHEKEN